MCVHDIMYVVCFFCIRCVLGYTFYIVLIRTSISILYLLSLKEID